MMAEPVELDKEKKEGGGGGGRVDYPVRLR